jgi:L-serine dehydratase
MSVVASVFDLFKIGVGPSSSHTMGPMTAACRFVETLAEKGLLGAVERVETNLYGSLALTGKGHATDRAVLIGLAGKRPDSLCPDEADEIVKHPRHAACARRPPRDRVRRSPRLRFCSRERLPHQQRHAFTALRRRPIESGSIIRRRRRRVERRDRPQSAARRAWDLPYNTTRGDELLAIAEREGLTIAEIAAANERRAFRRGDRPPAAASRAMSGLHRPAASARTAFFRRPQGERRAPGLHRLLMERGRAHASRTRSTVLDWVKLWALAVNEENAAGGRVVTAPTNGAAGIVPAILRYYQRFTAAFGRAGRPQLPAHRRAIGSLFKENASISGAEVGCQGEVGVACSMAAAGLHRRARRHARPGRECRGDRHGAYLGLTCDPVGGLVQVPCIERNAVGAIKAIEASAPRPWSATASPRQPRPGHRDDAQDRHRHERALQGDESRRPRRQRSRMLSSHRAPSRFRIAVHPGLRTADPDASSLSPLADCVYSATNTPPEFPSVCRRGDKCARC